MIILITGASHTGETALAQKLLEKYKCLYLSIKSLQMGLICGANYVFIDNEYKIDTDL